MGVSCQAYHKRTGLHSQAKERPLLHPILINEFPPSPLIPAARMAKGVWGELPLTAKRQRIDDGMYQIRVG